MRLDFNVLWVDDQPVRVEAQVKSIARQMEEEGFRFNPTLCKSMNETHALIADDVFTDEIDLILVDWDLGAGAHGEDAIAVIREQVRYKDVVFYSAMKPAAGLGELAHQNKLEGVFCASREDLVEEVMGPSRGRHIGFRACASPSSASPSIQRQPLHMSDCNRVIDLARANINETSLTAVRGVIISFAERKNIALYKGLPDVLAREVAARLDMPDLDRLLHSDADASAMAAYAVNRRLDEYAAMVLAKTAANVRDGTILSVETLERIGRTKADEIEADARQRSYRVWPNIAEEVLGAYPSLPLGPITEVLPDAVYKTCWLDCKLHRDPAGGPAYVKIDLQGRVESRNIG